MSKDLRQINEWPDVLLHRLTYHIISASFPLFMAAFLTIMYLFWEEVGLPPLPELLILVATFFENYGDLALLIAAFVEGLYMVNFYFPGSFVIVAAVYFSDKTIPQLVWITIICWVAFMGATVVNYYIGRWGLHRFFNAIGGNRVLEGMGQWLALRDKWAIFLTAFQPNYLAIASVSYGMAQLSLRRLLFLAGLSMVLTGAFLTTVVALFLTDMTNENSNLFVIMIILFYLWAAVIIAQGIWHDIKK